jgi:hypothetical protein
MSIVTCAFGLLLAVLTAAIGELVSDEIRARLDRLPFALLAAAGRRLPAQQRDELYRQAWLPELHHILRGDEATPITRLVHGTRFAASLWLSAPQVGRGLAPLRARAGEVTTWASLFPAGRDIYFEGNHPGVPIEDFVSYRFHCPAEHLDAIYGGDRFPMGS